MASPSQLRFRGTRLNTLRFLVRKLESGAALPTLQELIARKGFYVTGDLEHLRKLGLIEPTGTKPTQAGIDHIRTADAATRYHRA